MSTYNYLIQSLQSLLLCKNDLNSVFSCFWRNTCRRSQSQFTQFTLINTHNHKEMWDLNTDKLMFFFNLQLCAAVSPTVQDGLTDLRAIKTAALFQIKELQPSQVCVFWRITLAGPSYATWHWALFYFRSDIPARRHHSYATSSSILSGLLPFKDLHQRHVFQ